MPPVWRYLVVSNGQSRKWHTAYSAALRDVRRRLGVTKLHPTDGRTLREVKDPAERTFVHEGLRWHTVRIEEYARTDRERTVTVYCVGR